MAFEDRSSPSAAVSPSPHSPNAPTSPQANCAFPYTCTTLPMHHVDTLRSLQYTIGALAQNGDVKTAPQQSKSASFFRITSYALSSHNQRSPSAEKDEQQRRVNRISPEIKLERTTSPDAGAQQQGAQPKFCIDNILQPDFGKTAVLKTKGVAESTPSSAARITFRPYELTGAAAKDTTTKLLKSKVKPSSKPKQNNNKTTQNDRLFSSQASPINDPYPLNCTPFDAAPLGSLCHAVSQIGKSPASGSVSALKSGLGVTGAASALSPPCANGLAEPLKRCKSPAESTSGSSIQGDVSDSGSTSGKGGEDGKVPTLWPAWVYCTRYSDRPSSGPRSRRIKKPPTCKPTTEEKRPRTAFSGAQLARLKNEFAENRYLTERRRQQLSAELGLNEAQIKIWFQNKRAKIKKASGHKNPLALQLMAQGLYNHSTVPCDEDDMPLM